MKTPTENLPSITIEKATIKDLTALEQLMKIAQTESTENGYFCADDRTYLKEHIVDSNKGFILKASVSDDLAGFLMIHYPHLADNNLGYDVPLDPDELDQVAHFDSAVVSPDYRGLHIMGNLMEEAIVKLYSTPYRYYMATVHPDNLNSLKNLLKLHFVKIKTAQKYGGLPRNIMLYKREN